MGLAPLDVATLFDQVANLVRRDGKFTLWAGVQRRSDQEVVCAPIPLG